MASSPVRPRLTTREEAQGLADKTRISSPAQFKYERDFESRVVIADGRFEPLVRPLIPREPVGVTSPGTFAAFNLGSRVPMDHPYVAPAPKMRTSIFAEHHVEEPTVGAVERAAQHRTTHFDFAGPAPFKSQYTTTSQLAASTPATLKMSLSTGIPAFPAPQPRRHLESSFSLSDQ